MIKYIAIVLMLLMLSCQDCFYPSFAEEPSNPFERVELSSEFVEILSEAEMVECIEKVYEGCKGELTKDEFIFLLKSHRDLLELQTLTKEGLVK